MQSLVDEYKMHSIYLSWLRMILIIIIICNSYTEMMAELFRNNLIISFCVTAGSLTRKMHLINEISKTYNISNY